VPSQPVIPPVVWALLFAIASWAITLISSVDQLLFRSMPILIGLFGIAGVSIILLSIKRFAKTGTTANPTTPQNASHLVTSGPYRYTRNPMYFGILLILIGWAIHQQNLLAFLPVAAFPVTISRFQIIPEELALREKFPHDYEAYCKRVRRWI